MSRTDATQGHREALAWHHWAGVPVVAVLGGKSTVGVAHLKQIKHFAAVLVTDLASLGKL